MLTINSATGEYSVIFSDKLEDIRSVLVDNAFVIADRNIISYYGDIFKRINVIPFTATEMTKYPEEALRLCEILLENGITRKSKLVSIGGGITQDVTGFIANIMFRGIDWEFIPTTLLAQTDSCIGGKTSLNFHGYKNVMGTFYPPSKIYISSKFLDTLTDKDYCSGLGEVMKFMVLECGCKGIRERDWGMFREDCDKILDRAFGCIDSYIRSGLAVKKLLIELDEFDNDVRQYLNYGHTFGHAIESLSNYSVPHGLAIIYGMILANMISVELDMMSLKAASEINEIGNRILAKAGEKSENMFFYNVDMLLEKTRKDKKNDAAGLGVSMILVDNDFNCHKQNVSHHLIKKVWKHYGKS